MNWSQGGDFTKSLLSLQLQLQTLLEGVGGDETAGLLDALAKLSDSERALVIPMLTRVINRLVESGTRLQSSEDLQMQDFENSLYESVLSAMGDVVGTDAGAKEKSQAKLAIVPGGKSPEPLAFKKPVRIPSLIDLAKVREDRKAKKGRSRDDSY
jgi:hypothetical protein